MKYTTFTLVITLLKQGVNSGRIHYTLIIACMQEGRPRAVCRLTTTVCSRATT